MLKSLLWLFIALSLNSCITSVKVDIDAKSIPKELAIDYLNSHLKDYYKPAFEFTPKGLKQTFNEKSETLLYKDLRFYVQQVYHQHHFQGIGMLVFEPNNMDTVNKAATALVSLGIEYKAP